MTSVSNCIPSAMSTGGVQQSFDRMTRFATLATCSLNQWQLDFDGNQTRIEHSIREAKAKGARLRLGPELEVTGYGCEDGYLESDTLVMAWQTIANILSTDLTDNIVCDIGMPVLHRGCRFNCRVICLNRQILLIRPKMFMADDGNYRETRWFTAWTKGFVVEDFFLPKNIYDVTGQVKAPFGPGIIRFADTAYAVESCEELFTANNTGISFSLAGADIIGNGSGSHHTLRKRTRRLELIEEQTKKCGGIYLYSNQLGMDGGRLYFDGTSAIVRNGETIGLGKQFDITECEVVTSTVSLHDVWNYRAAIASRGVQAAQAPEIPRIDCHDFALSTPRAELITPVTMGLPKGSIRQHTEEEEVAFGPSCWLWDYLRRSGLPGYFLPLSGGVDSAATASLVGIMCQEVVKKIRAGCEVTRTDVQRITRDDTFIPKDHKELANRIFYCVYMGTKNSSQDTRERAQLLAADIGCSFSHCTIDGVVSEFEKCFEDVSESLTGNKMTPNLNNLESQENIACQNIQARSRMVLAYECAQLMLCTRPENKGKKWPGTLLVLGSANLDEAYRGYYTKYDCSSADLNPIGGICKMLLRRFLWWCAENRGFKALQRIVESKPSAELQPMVDGQQAQISEDEMGLSFEELGLFGSLRVDDRCGPLLMYYKARDTWPEVEPKKLAEQIKKFHRYYGYNRHKMTTLPPAYHMESFGCDDNRYDLRPFLYPNWNRQFASVDEAAEAETKAKEESKMPERAPTNETMSRTNSHAPSRAVELPEDVKAAMELLRNQGYSVQKKPEEGTNPSLL